LRRPEDDVGTGVDEGGVQAQDLLGLVVDSLFGATPIPILISW